MVVFSRDIQVGNHVDRHLGDYSMIDHRRIKLTFDEDARFLRIDWTNAEAVPQICLVPWTAVDTVTLGEEPKKFK